MASEAEEDEFLPDHCVTIRRALAYCKELLRGYDSEYKNINSLAALPAITVSKEAAQSALALPEQRRQALERFWERQQASQVNETNGSPSHDTHAAMTVIDIASSSSTSALEFRQQFQNGNIPCLLLGFDKSSCFSAVCSKWRSNSSKSGGGCKAPALVEGNEKEGCVNRTWFQQILGNDSKVPVRYQQSSSQTVLDDEGRADECETKEMTMGEWIDFLEQAQEANLTKTSASPSDGCNHSFTNYYLKDWHLQSHLRDASDEQDPLYQVPPYFQHDLLNSFLTRFTKGDYMFTYWGPKGSRTSLHSDVMSSFSWSFNVAGIKKWTFFPPMPDDSTHKVSAVDDTSPTSVTFIQRPGECIFVSSGWKHEVVNLEETLSINHNWITTANMDQTWECMCLEMKAIESELEAWGMVGDCWDARESMLRGCVGLDVSAFFFMLLTRLLELILKHTTHNSEEDWQFHFDLVGLREELLILLHSGGLIRLEDRLAAVIMSEESASAAIALASWATACVHYPTNYDENAAI